MTEIGAVRGELDNQEAYFPTEHHIFRHQGIILALDVRRCKVFRISELQSLILNGLMDASQEKDLHNIAGYASSDIEQGLCELVSLGLVHEGYWSSSPLAPEQSWGDRWELMINVSHLCNLRCGYCYAGFGSFGGTEGIMSTGVAEQLVEFAFSLPGNAYHFSFYGGEPMLASSIIKHIVKDVENRIADGSDKQVTYQITTNGTLITPEDIAMFSRKRFKVLVSLDGPQQIHDAQRRTPEGVGTHANIMSTIGLLRDSGISIGTDAVIYNGVRLRDVIAFFRSIDQLAEIKAEPVKIHSSSPFSLSCKDQVQYREDLIEFAEAYVEALLTDKPMPSYIGFDSKILQFFLGTRRSHFCNAGIRRVGIAYDGILYPCGPQAGTKWILGTVFEGLDQDVLHEYIKAHDPAYQSACLSCWARYFCGGGCAALRYISDKAECENWKRLVELSAYMFHRIICESPVALMRVADPKGYFLLS